MNDFTPNFDTSIFLEQYRGGFFKIGYWQMKCFSKTFFGTFLSNGFRHAISSTILTAVALFSA